MSTTEGVLLLWLEFSQGNGTRYYWNPYEPKPTVHREAKTCNAQPSFFSFPFDLYYDCGRLLRYNCSWSFQLYSYYTLVDLVLVQVLEPIIAALPSPFPLLSITVEYLLHLPRPTDFVFEPPGNQAITYIYIHIAFQFSIHTTFTSSPRAVEISDVKNARGR